MTANRFHLWRDHRKLPFAVFLGIGGYFLWTEHQAHVIEFLPWLLVLGCVGMHFFMHGGHGDPDGGKPRADHPAASVPNDRGGSKR